MKPANTPQSSSRDAVSYRRPLDRPRQSLPITTSTPVNHRVRDERQLHTLPRNTIRGKQARLVVNRTIAISQDKMTMSRRLDQSNLSPREDGISRSSGPLYDAGAQRTDSGIDNPDRSTRQLSTSFTELDEVDEISVLGIDMPELMFEYDKDRRTPDRFLDDMSFKMESPANFSINELYDDAEMILEKMSPERATTVVKVEAERDAPTVNTLTGTDNVNDTEHTEHGEAIPIIQAVLTSPLSGAMPVVPDSIVVEHEASVSSDQSNSPGTDHVSTPANLNKYMPFADQVDINTPARPIEASHLCSSVVRPRQSSRSTSLTPSVSHMRNSAPELIPDGAATSTETAISQTASLFPAPEGQKDHEMIDAIDDTERGLKHDDQILEAAVSHSRPQSASSSNSINDKAATSSPEGLPIAFATPNVDLAVPAKASQPDLPLARQLGSAIKLATGSWRDSTDVTPRELAYEPRKSTLKLSTPLMTRTSITTSSSVPLKRSTRMHTPPPRKRQSMDVPLSRLQSSIEIWENPKPIVRSRSANSPSPQQARPTNVLRTPSPRQRLSMDVPLARQAEDTEVWNGPHENARGPRRRTLVSPPARRRSSSTSQLIVDESPQTNLVQGNQEAAAQNLSKTMPQIPKLDFGLGAGFKTARSLIDDRSFPEDRNLHEVGPEAETDMQVEISVEKTKNSAQLKHNNTPRSSKLRLLARKLAEDENSSDDMLEVPELAMSETRGDPTSPLVQPASPHQNQDSIRSPNEVLSPRTARRKELSDDVILDFAEDVPAHGRQLTSSTPESGHGMAVRTPGGQESPVNLPTIATPVFTMRRNVKTGPQQSAADDISSIEPHVSAVKSNGKATKSSRTTATKSSRPASILKSQLATFGAAPPELPRSRRERKKPSEFWKIQSEEVTLERPASPVRPLPKPKRNAKRKREVETETTTSLAVASPTEVTVEPKGSMEPTRPSKKRKRPSDFRGPVSSQHKIVGHSRALNVMSHERGKPIPKRHNFADSE